MRKPRHSSVVDKLNLMKFQFQLSPELIQSTGFLSHTRPVQLVHNIVTEFRSNISISTLFFVCWFYVHNIFFVFINIEIYVNNISHTVLPSHFYILAGICCEVFFCWREGCIFDCILRIFLVVLRVRVVPKIC